MEVRLADCAGFCFGVKRAVDTVYEQLKNGKTIYTYGPIVHNEEVVKELSEKGVRVLENKEDLKQLKAGENIPTVIIRAHGVSCNCCGRSEAPGGRGNRRLVSGSRYRSGDSRSGREFCENRG